LEKIWLFTKSSSRTISLTARQAGLNLPRPSSPRLLAYEQRNINWSSARGRWDVASGLKKQTQLDTLIAFFRARKGRAHGFRFKDWTDYKATGQAIGTGDGYE
jgi:hypothetical protein